MKTAEQWLSEYGQTHKNPTNKMIHYICVPLILWSVLALLWVAPRLQVTNGLELNWAILFVGMSLGFYMRLGLRYFLEMLLVAALFLGSVVLLERTGAPVGVLAIAIFISAWVGQFYGHKVEGKKPSFFEDLLFLLIGPLWIQERLTRKFSGRS